MVRGLADRYNTVLRRIPGVKPSTVMECCGHDGTYAMTVEGFEPSCRIGRKSFEGMKDGSAAVWSTDCPLAALQFEQRLYPFQLRLIVLSLRSQFEQLLHRIGQLIRQRHAAALPFRDAS